MTVLESLVPLFEREMTLTRKTLERVPDLKFDWKPHPRSTAMGALALHIAEYSYLWAPVILSTDSFDISGAAAAAESAAYPRPKASCIEEVLQVFDANVASLRGQLNVATDERLLAPWSLVAGGRPLFPPPMTRMTALLGMVLLHVTHHRAQLGVYLRLNDIPVPALYGPSADELPG